MENWLLWGVREGGGGVGHYINMDSHWISVCLQKIPKRVVNMLHHLSLNCVNLQSLLRASNWASFPEVIECLLWNVNIVFEMDLKKNNKKNPSQHIWAAKKENVGFFTTQCRKKKSVCECRSVSHVWVGQSRLGTDRVKQLTIVLMTEQTEGTMHKEAIRGLVWTSTSPTSLSPSLSFSVWNLHKKQSP